MSLVEYCIQFESIRNFADSVSEMMKEDGLNIDLVENGRGLT